MAMYQDKIETVDMRPKVKVRDLTPSRNSYSTVINPRVNTLQPYVT